MNSLNLVWFLGASTGTTSTTTMHFSHNNSNNNNMNSSNLNLTSTHNGFGLNHNSINQTHHNNHSNNFISSSSVLTYRSNRRSMDRSDNKITDGISPSSSTSPSASTSIRNALPCNDTIHEGVQSIRSLSTFLRFIYKTLMHIYYSISKRRPTTIHHNPNNKLSESVFSRIMSILKYRVVGNDGNSYSRSISNDCATEQTSYIERIDDENMENNDQSHQVNTNVTTKVATAPTASTAQSNSATFEHPIGNFASFENKNSYF